MSNSVNGDEIIAYIKSLLAKGTVRRLIVRKPNGDVLIDASVNAGLGIGAVMLLLAPLVIALASIGALLAKFTVEVIHQDQL